MMNEKDILSFIRQDEWMMRVLDAAKAMDLPDWMIGAGFVRNKVWDVLHGTENRMPIADIDLIYFNPSNIEESQEKDYDLLLKEKLDAPWSTKNQARMNFYGQPYTSSKDALAHWVEIPTCVAVKLGENASLELIAPHGIDDLVNLIVRPNPYYKDKMEVYRERIEKKKWKEKWPRLEIFYQ